MDKRTNYNSGSRGNGGSAWRGQGRGQGRNSGGYDRGNSGGGGNYYYQQRQGSGGGDGSGSDYYYEQGQGRRDRSGTHDRGGYQNRPPSSSPFQGGGPRYSMTNQEPSGSLVGYGGRGEGAWTGKRWAPSQSGVASSSSSSSSQIRTQNERITHEFSTLSLSSQTRTQNQTPNERIAHESSPDPVKLDIQRVKIPEQKPATASALANCEKNLLPMKRPDRGTVGMPIRLLANHFRVRFNPKSTIIHYDVDVKQVSSHGNQLPKRSVHKSDLRSIRDKLFSDNPELPPLSTLAYDGEKNIFSAVPLPTKSFRVDFPGGEDGNGRSYVFTIKEVNVLQLSKLKDYLSGNLSYIPRDILQGMDLVMKENPATFRIPVGRSFFSKNHRADDDLNYGVAAYRGFQQSLKPTSEGLTLCLDYSVLAFRKPLAVIDFLIQYVEGFRSVDDVNNLKKQVESALKGLKVKVTHRKTNQKYTIAGLTKNVTRDLGFNLVDQDGQAPPRWIALVNYFLEKYEKKIVHQHIPCLELGKGDKNNHVPLEFCILVEGQRCFKEDLDRDSTMLLKKISLAPPADRKNTICEMVQARDGPVGDVTRNFGIDVDKNMTMVNGRVIGPPELRLGAPNGGLCTITVDPAKCHWNLVGRSVVEGKSVERWALIDFGSKLFVNDFIKNLKQRCRKLGMHMEDPLVLRRTSMYELSSLDRTETVLSKVVNEAKRKGGLQVIICAMAEKHDGYKYIKWVSETKIGIVTQCCLSYLANKGQDQYLANLCLKINAKLGGSNVELNERLPHFVNEDSVMFIGADVNHPAARNSTCPSIAAVVATINWPAANRYVARVHPQAHRKEKITNFGAICKELVDTYARHNNMKPKKIVVFRDGVSEGQFDMVLNEELYDLKQAIEDDHYKPAITLVVAQKRHQTRLFFENGRNRTVANVPPGTVVDRTIVHPFEFDFYLCSHYGSLGTSKPTHYYGLLDENCFTSDELQKLIYNLCYTYARCTKPVSLVPPVYYADLVAYRGRLFQEVLMQNPQSPAPSVSSSSSGTSVFSSSTSAASFDQCFYKLHPDLQKVMFFV